MCGIAGYVNITQPNLIERMCAVMAHRGPDDEGIYKHKDVALGHRRLAIIDLSQSGHQPMSNENGTVWITYNGEIYNYLELREQLQRKGHIFRSKSDTEVIIHAYEEWGVECLQRFNGMFAFVIYDRKKCELFIARDRIGIKPLYYWQNGTKLIVASEIKAILEADVVQRNPNLHAISEYLALRYVPGPESLIEGIYKLPAGYYAIFRNGGQFDLTCYWKPEIHTGPYRDDEYYFETFADLLEKAVQRRLMSDVPFGAYLSGGLDSSVIVALMSQMLDQPVKTFSVGFDSPKDELSNAKFVATHLNCDHQEVIVRPEDFRLLPKIVWHLDEPQGDAIVLPTFILSTLAEQSVKMVLTGEGADEMLAGYQFHKIIHWSNFYMGAIPKIFHTNIVCPLLRAIPASIMNLAFIHPGDLGEKGKKKIFNYTMGLYESTLEDKYHSLISLFEPEDIQTLQVEHGDAKNDYSAGSYPQKPTSLGEILHLQFSNWLPQNILWRQDKMTMANSIEGRVPFLDHTLVEFAMALPPRLKIRGLTGKYLLRHYGKRFLPDTIAHRKKKPFYIPLEKFVHQKGFTELLNRTLSEEQINKRGIFNYDYVKQIIARVEDNDFLYAKQIFSLMMLELWFQIYIDRNNVETA